MTKFLIVNADDFGVSRGVNCGIAHCHRAGIVTSTSLMVQRPGFAEAVRLARKLPRLSVGLHFDGGGDGLPEMEREDHHAIRLAFQDQLDSFVELMGRPPTHVDSEQHFHRKGDLLPLFRELVEPLGVPLRHDGKVHFVGGFYAQWKYLETDLGHVSIQALLKLLRDELNEEWTEFSCHPGYCTPDHQSPYYREREEEIRTLTHPAIRQEIDRLGIRLVSYSDYTGTGSGAALGK